MQTFETGRRHGAAGPPRETSALRALAITALSMVLAEIASMGVVAVLPPSSFLATSVLDAFLMIALGFPVLYVLSFRPLEAANRAEREARAAAETIRSAAIALTRTLDLEKVLGLLFAHLERLVPFDRARVFLREGDSLLRVRAVLREGSGPEFPRDAAAFDGEKDSVLRDLLETGTARVLADTHAHPEWGPRMRPGFERSWMGIPLVAGGRAIGLYSVSKAEVDFFRAEHARLAEALSAPASVAIHNATLFEELLEGRKRLQTLSRQLVDLQESERRFVARELHDEAGQVLTSLKIGLRLLERGLSDPRAMASSVELYRMAEELQDSLHRLAANLRPPSLDALGLVAAIGQLAEAFSGSGGVRVEFETVGLDERLPSRMETDLYRIAQEAVTNAARHAGASQIGVVLERRGGRVRLLVEDDGRGFDWEEAERGGRLGLVGMRERAEMLGGRLFIETGAGGGTTVVAEVPLGA